MYKGFVIAASIYPSLENIRRLKVKLTEGELYLLEKLLEHFSHDEVEIYFQPFFNGDRPDIVLMKKNVGVTVIEVKDWNLQKYYVDSNNKWHVRNRDREILSPFQQVFRYKESFFNLHINGLLEKKIENNYFYGRVNVFVYFHKANQEDLKNFYKEQVSYWREEKKQLGHKKISHDDYNKQADFISRKQTRIERDIKLSIGYDSIQKIRLPQEDQTGLFSDSILIEFRRYLQPPYHTLEQGKEIVYTLTQKEYIDSKPGHEKIRGVAGSGKTVLLAKRAVNAHKRHGGRVLILTYNLTLMSYIHDRISDVREGFYWNQFYIINYHEFFKQRANEVGFDISLSDQIKEKLENTYSLEEENRIKDEFYEKKYYSNLDFFDGCEDIIEKYDSIFIDEVQDYQPEWVKIIRKYFAHKTTELVLFGDEKQNIYERSLDNEKRFTTPQGFGKWNKITQNIRQNESGGRVSQLLKNFQEAFFTSKYILDEYDNGLEQAYLDLGLFKFKTYENINSNKKQIVNKIYEEIRKNNFHPNDVCILSSKIKTIQEIDKIIREDFNEKTITTFEPIEEEGDIALRRFKKVAFNLNSGVIKLSTIHSFKGFEAKIIFLIINDHDNEELIYTGLSRTKSDLMIFSPENSRYNEFFSANMQVESTNNPQDVFEILKECVSKAIVIDLHYEVHGGVIQQINVKPYKILFMNDNFYLACEVDNKYKFSMFRISNIQKVIKSNTAFYKDPDIADFIQNIQTPFAKYRSNYKSHLIDIKVEVLKQKAQFFKAKKFMPSQNIIETKDNGNLIVTFQVTQELEIEELIKRWLPYLKVLEPLTLDEKIKNDIRLYLN